MAPASRPVYTVQDLQEFAWKALGKPLVGIDDKIIGTITRVWVDGGKVMAQVAMPNHPWTLETRIL